MNREPAKPPDSTAGAQPSSDHDESVLPSFIALGFALLLVFLGVWLFTAKHKNQQIQDCFAEHRQDCVPLDTSR
jgi:flagellar biogenesis protein FliO